MCFAVTFNKVQIFELDAAQVASTMIVVTYSWFLLGQVSRF